MHKRRVWASQVAAFNDGDYTKLQDKIAAAEAAHKRRVDELEEQHARTMHPMIANRDEKLRLSSAASDALRQLRDTADAESIKTLTAPVDEDLQIADAKHAELGKEIGDRESWILTVQSRGQRAATSDLNRLPSALKELERWKADERKLKETVESLRKKREAVIQAAILDPRLI